MPEGDTIHRLADTLRPLLLGKPIARIRVHTRSRSRVDRFLRATPPRPLAGRTVIAVEPYGKHLLLRFDDGRALRTHLGMHGFWQVYRPKEPWRQPEAMAEVVLETEDDVLVCFRPAAVELLGRREAARPSLLRALGPDILGEAFDARAAALRIARLPGSIAEALLDQRGVAGIGNVYKSEVLFACGVDPEQRASDVPVERLAALLEQARSWMRQNLATPGRRTRPWEAGAAASRARYFVYGRAGLPCFRCGGPVRMVRSQSGRSTYFCARCQPACV